MTKGADHFQIESRGAVSGKSRRRRIALRYLVVHLKSTFS